MKRRPQSRVQLTSSSSAEPPEGQGVDGRDGVRRAAARRGSQALPAARARPRAHIRGHHLLPARR